MSDNPLASNPSRRTDWAALERYETFKAVDGYRDPRLPVDPGPVHALRWTPGYRPEEPEGPNAPDFFRGNPVYAECGRPVRVRLNIEIDPSDPDACSKCAAIVRGEEPRPRRNYGHDLCSADVTPDGPGGRVVMCVQQHRHYGPHRGSRGDTWEHGADDYTPPPDGYV